MGPLVYLRDKIGGQGAELMSSTGKVRVVAKVNLLPYQAPMGQVKEWEVGGTRTTELWDSDSDSSMISSEEG